MIIRMGLIVAIQNSRKIKRIVVETKVCSAYKYGQIANEMKSVMTLAEQQQQK